MNMIDQAAKGICKDIYRGDFDNLDDGNPLKEVCRDMARAAIEALRGDGLELVDNHLEECFKGFNDTRKACYFIDDEGEINSYRMGVKNALLIFHQNLDKALEEQ